MVKRVGGGGVLTSHTVLLLSLSLSSSSSLGAWSSVILGGGDWPSMPLLVDPWGIACAGWLHGCMGAKGHFTGDLLIL